MSLPNSTFLLNGRVHIGAVHRGGTGIIREGLLRPGEKRVAVRVCHFSGPWDQQANERVLHEIRLLTSLEHPNIHSMLGIIIETSKISIVTPWKDRGNAHDYVQNRMVDPRPLLRGIANGLFYLHHQGPEPIIHGNLKGTNVLISDDGLPELSDFTCSFSFPSGMSPPSATGITSAIWCAPRWTAPECIDNGGVASVKGDVWAFGMTALELFTGKLPFHDISQTQGVIIRIMKGPPDRPSGESTYFRMTDKWWAVCLRCWTVVPSRPQISQIVDKINEIPKEPQGIQG
ncbi:kinase-like domain-containing protein [Scleroderma yunnanense]